MTTALNLAQRLFPKRDPDTFSTSFLDACQLALEAQRLPNQRLVSSIEAMEVLVSLNLDDQTYITTLLSDLNLNALYSVQDLENRFGKNIAKLVEGTRRLNQFKDRRASEAH